MGYGFDDPDDRVKKRFKLSPRAVQALECVLRQPGYEELTDDDFVDVMIRLGHEYVHRTARGQKLAFLDDETGDVGVIQIFPPAQAPDRFDAPPPPNAIFN